MQTRTTASCGCYTDRRALEQHKCPEHSGNRTSPGYTRI